MEEHTMATPPKKLPQSWSPSTPLFDRYDIADMQRRILVVENLPPMPTIGRDDEGCTSDGGMVPYR